MTSMVYLESFLDLRILSVIEWALVELIYAVFSLDIPTHVTYLSLRPRCSASFDFLVHLQSAPYLSLLLTKMEDKSKEANIATEVGAVGDERDEAELARMGYKQELKCVQLQRWFGQ